MEETTKPETTKNDAADERDAVKARCAELRKRSDLQAIDRTVLDSIEKRAAQRWPVGPVRLGILARMEREASDRDAEAKKAKTAAPATEPTPATGTEDDPVPMGGKRSGPGKR